MGCPKDKKAEGLSRMRLEIKASEDEDLSSYFYEDEKIIRKKGVLMAEGIYNRALRLYEEFKDYTHWLMGQPLVRGDHPQDMLGNFVPVTAFDDIFGKISEVVNSEERRAAIGTFDFFKDKISVDEAEALRNGGIIGTSEGYWCMSDVFKTPQVWEVTGQEYDLIERKPFLYDHVATPAKPACKPPVCGINVKGDKTVPEDKTPPVPTDEELAKETFVVNSTWDVNTLKAKILSVLAIADDYTRYQKSNALLVQILAAMDEIPLETYSHKTLEENMPEQKEIPEEMKLLVKSLVDDGLKEGTKDLKLKLDEAAGKIAEQATVITELQAEKTARDAKDKADKEAVVAAQEAQAQSDFAALLKPGITPEEATALYAEAKGNVSGWIAKNPEKIAITGKSEKKPVGYPGAAGQFLTRSEEEEMFSKLGIETPDKVMKSIYPEHFK